MRSAEIKRKTKETDIILKIKLLSVEESSIDTGVPFLDHMLSAIAKHGRVKLDVKCIGDVDIDDHHSVEDIGICLGMAFKEALGDKAGIKRYGFSSIPMDEALCQVSVDLSGRTFYKYTGPILDGYIGNYNAELTTEFLYAFASNALINLHVNLLYGENRHHIHEAIFKALAKSIYEAYSIDPVIKDQIPSTKGNI